MAWLPVMTLPDASAIETVLPSSDTVGTELLVSGYRVRHPDGWTSEFRSLTEVATYLRARFDSETYDSIVGDLVMACAKSNRTAAATHDAVPPAARLDRLDPAGDWLTA